MRFDQGKRIADRDQCRCASSVPSTAAADRGRLDPRVNPTDAHTDIEAVRGDERIIGEAKGRTSDRGTDADTAYRQLLRKMTTTDSPRTRYALIVPSSSVPAAQRVPVKIRRMLNLDVFEVTDDNAVRLLIES